MPREKRFPAVAKAIRTAKEQLTKMASSKEVHALRSDIQSIEAEVDGWTLTPPATGEREGMMQKVMAVHIAITKLVRPR